MLPICVKDEHCKSTVGQHSTTWSMASISLNGWTVQALGEKDVNMVEDEMLTLLQDVILLPYFLATGINYDI